MTTPGWLNAAWKLALVFVSGSPNELDTSVAPSATALFSAVARSLFVAELASTRMILQPWQTECTVSTSRLSSTDQPKLSSGGGAVPPDWLTTRRQPFVVLHAARL